MLGLLRHRILVNSFQSGRGLFIRWFSTSMVPPSSASSVSSSLVQLPPRLVVPMNGTENLGERLYRYADLTGFLTRWNSRKAWIMYLDPFNRLQSIMITEYERKLKMFLNLNEVLMFSLSFWIWWSFMNHFNSHPPPPRTTQDGINAEHKGSHLNPFSRLPGIQPKNRCYECRWLDLECKRKCFDKLRKEGHKFRISQYPLTVPRYQLEDPHHHTTIITADSYSPPAPPRKGH